MPLPTNSEFVRGLRIYLRPLEPEDLNARYLRWLNDPEVTAYMETGTFPTTAADLEKFYNEVTRTRDHVILAVADKKSGQHIGNVKLGPIHWVHRSATFGMMIGDQKFWGKGVGLEATRLMVEYGFDRLNLRRIELGVFAEHKAAVRCYEKAGFKVEGCLRESLFKDGTYKDKVLMGLLRSEYAPPKLGSRK
jgi:ribosomal-protein-alanine N-acetyltransferase